MSVTSEIAPAASPARPGIAAVIELLKPITWFAPMWAFACGVVSSGASLSDNWVTLIAGIILCGPLVCGTSQAANDWYDRDVDAINEPNRPIPSGRVPGQWGFYIACAGTVLSLVLAALLGPAVVLAAVIGLVLAWIYSAPPLRLKMNGWWSAGVVGACYEGLPWFTGAAVMLSSLPGWEIVAIAVLYSIGAHGIMTLNDFKAVEGDTRHGVLTLPVQLGVANAARLACAVMALPQIIVIALLGSWGQLGYAALVGALLATQLAAMLRLLEDPKRWAPWYNATGTTLYVLGMLASAFALRAV